MQSINYCLISKLNQKIQQQRIMNQTISYIRSIVSPLEQVVNLNDHHLRFQHLQKISRMPAKMCKTVLT